MPQSATRRSLSRRLPRRSPSAPLWWAVLTLRLRCGRRSAPASMFAMIASRAGLCSRVLRHPREHVLTARDFDALDEVGHAEHSASALGIAAASHANWGAGTIYPPVANYLDFLLAVDDYIRDH